MNLKKVYNAMHTTLMKMGGAMVDKKGLNSEDQFFVDICNLLHAGREAAYSSVNTVMVKTYWQIEKRIVEQEQQGKTRAEYGISAVFKMMLAD
jgi:hypothetical protein